MLVRGASIHGANGIMFDAHDRLYIASVVGREILVMEPKTGKIIAKLDTEMGVEGPDDRRAYQKGHNDRRRCCTGRAERDVVEHVERGERINQRCQEVVEHGVSSFGIR